MLFFACTMAAQEDVDERVAPPPPPPRGDLVLRGSVADEITRAPLRRALVQANCGNGGFAALSDAAGSFAITGIAPGECQLSVQKPGYIAKDDPQQIEMKRSRSDITLTLTPGASVAGRVVDSAGDPVANVWVQALQSNVLEGRRRMQTMNSAYTNDLGRYRITGLSPGVWFLRAVENFPQTRTQGGLQNWTPPPGVAWPPIYYGGAEGEKSATPVKLSAAATFDADFAVTLQPGFSITGKLEGFTQGQPADIQLLRTSDNDNVASALYNFSTGRFAISDIPAGSYYLRATSGTNQAPTRGFEAVEVNGDIRNLVVSLMPGTDIHGELQGSIEEKTQGATLGSIEGAPRSRGRAGCMVSLRPWTFDRDWKNHYSAQAEPGGEFVFEHVLPDRYRLEARCHPSGWVRSATYGDVDVLRQSFLVSGGGQKLRIELGDKSGKVSGTVKDESGAPATAHVVLIPDDGGTPLESFAIPQHGFRFQSVPPGRYRAYAWSQKTQAEFANPEWVRNFSQHGRDVSVDGDSEATVDLDLIDEENQ